MRITQEIINKVRARDAGQLASHRGLKLDANPYPEESDLHWEWLNSWCNEEMAKRGRIKQIHSPNTGGEVGPPEGGPLSTTLLPGRDRI